MTTEVELLQYFFPLVSHINQTPETTRHTGCSPTTATAPAIEHSDIRSPAIEHSGIRSPAIEHSALVSPTIESSVLVPSAIKPSAIEPTPADDNGNFNPSSPTPCLTERLLQGGHTEQHFLAQYLSSGDENDLNISNSNIQYYLQFAVILHHTTLERLCEEFLLNNKNKSWESDTCSAKTIHNDTDKANGNNNLNLRVIGDSRKLPKFQILFLKQFQSDDHLKVLVMDVRKLNGDQTILDVKKVSRFQDGFACCTAYVKQCPYIYFSGRHSKRDNSLIKYDVVGHKWMHCADMKYPRSKHMMAFCKAGIYIFGGKACGAVEIYNVIENCCSEIACLPVAVHSAAHVVCGNKIFIFGGKTLRGDVAAVQCIDTSNNHVSRVADLPFPCSGGQAIVVKENIYFATRQGHLIKFYPLTGLTELCAKQPYRRKQFVMFEKEDMLHLFGGVRTDGHVKNESSMYQYDVIRDQWEATLSFTTSLPVQASCSVIYPKECPIRPFTKLFGYC